MVSQSSKIFLLLNIFSVIRASHLETVHFTNSANKILKANNFTTYKVDVPNGEHITIIEANVPLIDKKIKFDDAEVAAQYPKRHDDSTNRKYNKPVMDLETSLSMTVTPNNYHDEYENSAAASSESVKNDYSNLLPERNNIKTVYSPELLQKFLKDYANKVQMASTASTENFNENFAFDEKDKYVDSQEQTNVNDDDGNRRVSLAENEDKSEEELEDVQQRKNYRPGGHPYNKNSGWVTLDAVPWSKSKVSRWQSNQKYQGNYNNRPYRPQSSYDYDYGNRPQSQENDDFYSSKPSRPTYHNNQFYNSKPQESQSWHTSQQFHSSSYEQRPNRPEIITDNRPSNFPSHHNDDHYHQPPQQQHNYAFSKPYNRPSSYGSNDYSFNDNRNQYHGYKDGPHPQTYPQNGDGEWILVSTTKGYQYPKRSGQRAMSFKAQNSVGSQSDSQYNDRNGIITAAESQKVDTVVRPPNKQQHHYSHRPGPTKMTQQPAVKLTVLPLFISDKKQQSNYGDKVNVSLYKPSSASSYHGIIESDQSDLTVEESAQNAQAVTAAPATQKKKRKVVKKKNFALMRKNGGSDPSAMIAAVGASLLPASLGLIAPMVLGK